MPEKDPTTWAGATWVLAVCMAFGGGLVSWWAKVKQGHTRMFNFAELVGEMFTSGFVGIVTFMGLAGLEQPLGLCAAAAGISGHMATRLLFVLERAAETKLKAYIEKGGAS